MYAGCLPHFSSHDVAADWHMIVFMNPAITGSGTCEVPAQSANFRGWGHSDSVASWDEHWHPQKHTSKNDQSAGIGFSSNTYLDASLSRLQAEPPFRIMFIMWILMFFKSSSTCIYSYISIWFGMIHAIHHSEPKLSYGTNFPSVYEHVLRTIGAVRPTPSKRALRRAWPHRPDRKWNGPGDVHLGKLVV
jgi:hypothetical protein